MVLPMKNNALKKGGSNLMREIDNLLMQHTTASLRKPLVERAQIGELHQDRSFNGRLSGGVSNKQMMVFLVNKWWTLKYTPCDRN